MNYMHRFNLCLAMLVGLGVFACKPATEKSTSPTNNVPEEIQLGSQEPQPVPAAAAAAASGQANSENFKASTDPQYVGLTSIQIEAMRDLYDNCTSLDVIFYDTNFSLSQTDQEAIRTTLFYLIPSPVVHNANCKPIGRITFLVNGEIRREADIYCGDACNYFIWIENGKPAYINPMTPEGITFFEQILKKGKEQFK